MRPVAITSESSGPRSSTESTVTPSKKLPLIRPT